MRIVVLSGKGGTGKTTVATNLALSLNNVQLMDADVEEPDDYVFIKADFADEYEAVNNLIPFIDENKCRACRKCVNFCQYNALALMLENILVFPELCHSCGGCSRICPEKAITERAVEIGKIKWSKSVGDHGDIEQENYIEEKGLNFFQGELNIGEERAVPVIKQLMTHIDNEKVVIIDAQPGTTCPTIEAAIDSDYCILVTEPTPFGLNDLKIAIEVIRDIDKPTGVIINRSEAEYDYIIEDYLHEEDIPLLMKIPFERKIAELYSTGTPFVEIYTEWKERFQELYRVISDKRGWSGEENNSN